MDGEAKVLVADGERAQMLGSIPALSKIPLLVCRPENYKIPRGDSLEALVQQFGKQGKDQVPHVDIVDEDNSVVGS